ncbi:MAG: DSD1 family PLP-dependent enzyme [Exilibacterium sp.]
MTQTYFQNLTQALHQAGICTPTLVIDKQRLDHNIDQLMGVLKQGFDYRIVAKSLPSIPLLHHIMGRTGSRRLMSFHLPFLIHLVEQIPGADVLLGKPMPVAAARHFYRWYNRQRGHTGFAPESQLQWLVDGQQRLLQYQALAQELGVRMRINLEIDIGLHRGGFRDAGEFRQALQHLATSKQLQLSGLMGYEAHITKIPALLGGPQKAFARARQRYTEFVAIIKDTLGEAACADLCLNTGGSTTYPLYRNEIPGDGNEIATASALLKPTDFDVYTLEHHQPAAFIAAPVLKKTHNPEIPMAPGLSRLLRGLGKLPHQGCFIYGGNWLAQPYYPPGSKRSLILGHSSNQELYELAAGVSLDMDDFLFFRPTQSEAVLLQFDRIAVYEAGDIVDGWPVFSYPEPLHSYPVEARISAAGNGA